MELGASGATLVSTSPTESEVKLKRSRKSYLIVTGVLICAVGFLIATSLLADQVIRSRKQLDGVRQELHELKLVDHQQQQALDSVCWSKECIMSAAALLEAMDETVDPCEDFYKFTCGGWQKKNVIPRGYGRISQFYLLDSRIRQFIQDFFKQNSTKFDSKPVNNTRDMYKACIDTDTLDKVGVQPLVEILNLYGQWPMTVSNWTEENFDWRKMSASIRAKFGYGFLFEASNFVDIKNTDFSTIYLDQPSLGVPTFVLQGRNLTSYTVQAYARFISGVALIIRDAIGGKANNTDIVKDIEDMINFQIGLANILTPDYERWNWNVTRIYNPFSLPEFQAWTDEENSTESQSQIDWFEHFNDIYSVANVSIESDEKIIVMEPHYFKKLVKLLDETSPRVLANFFHWRLILENIYDLDTVTSVLAIEFWDALYGPQRLEPRKSWCIERVHRVMGFAIGSKYIESSFDHQAKSDMEEMIVQLKVAFSSLVEESDWMDKETKINALEKAAAMQAYIGYPDWISNRTTLEMAYQGIQTKPTTHFDNFRSAKEFMTLTNLRFLRFRTNWENLWISFPVVVNAFYYPLLNSITFPAGILQPPFYGRGRPAALNYGAIGVIIGHEITHGFDHQGHKSDKKGQERSWWTNQTLEEFYKRKQCIIDQYSNFSLPDLEESDITHLNGTQTQGENIADNGGLREAFRAYNNYVAVNGKERRLPGLEQYTPEQLFFMSYANVWCSNQTPESLEMQVIFGVHSPGRFRVLGPLSNSADFAQHFQCPVGSPMNPPKKCTVW